jgi:acetyl esterase/lipase
MPLLKSSRALFAFLTLLSLSVAPAQTNAPVVAPAPPPAPSVRPPPPGVVALHDVVTGKGGDRDLHAEVAYPEKATGLLPAIVYIHGGGWSVGSQKQGPVYDIAQHGFFAASVEYRLSREAKWPAQIQDCMLGVRWLRANAAQYHVDPNRIAVWGDSAGGHLAVCVGTMTDEKEYQGEGGYPGVSSAVQVVIDYYGPVDFTDNASNPPGTVGQHIALFALSYAQNPALWKSGSPLFYVKAGDPPMLIAHGDADVTVPIAQSILLDAALTKAAVPHEFIVVKNAGHGFRPLPGTTISPTGNDIKKAVYDFLAKYLKSP